MRALVLAWLSVAALLWGGGAMAEPVPTAAALNAHIEAAPDDADALFNLGLLEARQGNVARAILWLERAKLAAPLDREIEDVLTAARAEARKQRALGSESKVFMEGESSAVGWWRFFRALPEAWARAALLIAAWCWAVAVLVRRRIGAPSTARDLLLVVAIAVALVGLVAAGLVAGRAWTARDVAAAVVVAGDPRMRTAPDELAIARRDEDLYAGGIVRVTDERGRWLEVELVDGDRVWVDASTVEAIERGP